MTPLHMAATLSHEHVCKELVKGGADTHSKDGRGRIPLEIAGLHDIKVEDKDSRRKAVERLLKPAPIATHLPSTQGGNSLWNACASGVLKDVKKLLAEPLSASMIEKLHAKVSNDKTMATVNLLLIRSGPLC